VFNKIGPKPLKRKRAIRDIVGPGVLGDLETCISTAAKNKLIKNELITKYEERYIYSGTRIELLTELKLLFAEKLIRSDRAYIQAISLFAACGKYKRKNKTLISSS